MPGPPRVCEITKGTGDGSTYSPNDDVTRAQIAVFIALAVMSQ